MKLFIQIPCLNEEETLPLVLSTIPKKIPGIDQIELLVVDDGSKDKTVEIAKKHGVKHFVRHTRNKGLGMSFHDGVQYALEHGADIVVNTDGDNQYPSESISDLVQPIINKQADIVVADRQIAKIAHFSGIKKFLQKAGSKTVNLAAGTNIPDAASGFRAYSKESLIKINTITRFSYCMETIIQAGQKRLAITSIPIETNAKTRESRLFKSTPEHVLKSGSAIFRAYVMYRPYTIFLSLAAVLFVAGLFPFLRYLYFVIANNDGNHLQSLVAGTVLLICAFLCIVLGVLADLIRINRILIEDQLEFLKRSAIENSKTK